MTKATDLVSKEQLENMKVKDELIITTDLGTRFRIRKTNESKKCFSLYCLTTKNAICSRCKADYILGATLF